MKIFISWSKGLSKDCAEILRDWIKCTLQASDPWVSSKDIDKGSLWFNEINDQLKDTKVGVVCLTKENKENPWILFESGALAKGLSASRVCTFLIDLIPADLENPMAQFNHTMPDQESMKGLLTTINKELGVNRLEDRILDQVFETYWPIFDEKFKCVIRNAPLNNEVEPTRSNDDILTEILYTTRTLDKRIRSLEKIDNRNSGRMDASERQGYLDLIISMLENGLSRSEIEVELKGIVSKSFISGVIDSINMSNSSLSKNNSVLMPKQTLKDS